MSNQGYLDQPELHAKAPYRAGLLTFPGNLQKALNEAKEDPKKIMFGVAQGIPSVFVTKLLAAAQPDFIWLDVEHGMYNRLTLFDCIQAAQFHSEGKTMVMVRVPKHDEISLTTALDAGAAGIVLPHTESADDVKALIKEAFYPPLGSRSYSPWTYFPGISEKSIYPGDGFNIQTGNRHIAIIAQIESVKGIENIDEIAAVPGVAGLMFGRGDFSMDAGIALSMGEPPDPIFTAAMDKFVAAGKKYGKPLFGLAGASNASGMKTMIDEGYAAICVGLDTWSLTGMVLSGVSGAKALVEKVEAESAAAANGAAVVVPVNGSAKETESK
ncbi:Pyruvate/Phosphoenolpyruvate kinase-like domain-containing protein [Podospora didyma]|uniref:Pyruvate/Phosphoenolpyruvate kinase-like domain-containing protein n=1 Tax=Podospora didyma TaxID=330526 RepID=A0AAE0NPJ7_9PEZI|nr:Pyruvate/Phosphoenolpyruvate kinase-like domain-containing protein [Podospora didyma]